MLSPRTILSWN